MELAQSEVQAVESVVAEKTNNARQALSEMSLLFVGGGVGDVTLG